MDDGRDLMARIDAFVRQGWTAGAHDRARNRRTFEALALDAFAHQYDHIDAYRRLAEVRGQTPATVTRWQDVPAVPTGAFARMALHTATPREIFRSSGTTGGARSVHHHPYPELYRTVIDHSFPAACLRADVRPPMLALIPARDQLPDSSLGFMVDHVVQRFGSDDSTYAFGDDGVDVEQAEGWCHARIKEHRPVLLLATAFALVQWLDALEEQGRTLSLPQGSRLFETGGFKGRTREISRRELAARIERQLDLGSRQTVREYGMTELTSQLYGRPDLGIDPALLFAPPWVRIRVLDPETLDEAPYGTTGIIAIFDLANIGSAVHVLTEDLGQTDAETGGLRLLGRAQDADLRGCSLTVEELMG